MAENGGKTKRAIITVALPNVDDLAVVAIKQQIEELVTEHPESVVDLRMGTVPARITAPDIPGL